MLCWARIWLCSACWAGLGADLALLGVLGLGFGRAGRAGLVGRAGWVGRGFRPPRCGGLGWAWDVAVLGALVVFGRAGPAALGWAC